jgi:sulfonate transport system substrate-binding protein
LRNQKRMMAKSLPKIRIGGVPEHFNLPWKIWLESNSDIASEAEWDWKDFPGGSGAMLLALTEDQLDIALILTEAAANSIMQGAEIKALSIYVDSPLVWGIFSGVANPATSIEPVHGKKYAISRFGSGSHLMAKLDAKIRGEMLEENQFVLVQNLAGAEKALTDLEADLFFWEKWMTKPLVDQGIMKMLGERPTPWPCFVLVSSNSFWEKQENQKAVKIAFSEVLKIASQLKTDPNGYQKIGEAYGLQPEDAKTWLEHVKWAELWQDPENEIKMAEKALREL